MISAAPVESLGDDVTDQRLTRPDGRVVAWSLSGSAAGRPVLRVPGTPGSRLSIRADRSPWFERDVRMITTERPGFGASTRLASRGFDEHADDTIAILDAMGIDRLPVYGASGASPHILAIAARHPDRVSAVSIIVGAAPLDPPEVADLIDLNATEQRLFDEGRYDEIRQLTEDIRLELQADPIVAFRGVMATATPADRAILEDPAWQRGFIVGVGEAIRQGVDGWFDEDMAILHPWAIDLGAIRADVTWWHGDGDRNCPLSAARRLVGRLPRARINVWEDAGHLTPYHHEGQILDELLARA